MFNYKVKSRRRLSIVYVFPPQVVPILDWSIVIFQMWEGKYYCHDLQWEKRAATATTLVSEEGRGKFHSSDSETYIYSQHFHDDVSSHPTEQRRHCDSHTMLENPKIRFICIVDSTRRSIVERIFGIFIAKHCVSPNFPTRVLNECFMVCRATCSATCRVSWVTLLILWGWISQ